MQGCVHLCEKKKDSRPWKYPLPHLFKIRNEVRRERKKKTDFSHFNTKVPMVYVFTGSEAQYNILSMIRVDQKHFKAAIRFCLCDLNQS